MLPVLVARRRWTAAFLLATRPRCRRCRATALGVLWNAADALAAATVVVACAPTRLWAAGCSLQCLLHAACVIVEQWVGSEEDDDAGSAISLTNHLESETFPWWINGLYRVIIEGRSLTEDDTQISCSIMVILCALLDQDVASDEDILLLPRHNNLRSICSQGDLCCIGTCTFAGVITENETDHFIRNAWPSEQTSVSMLFPRKQNAVSMLPVQVENLMLLSLGLTKMKQSCGSSLQTPFSISLQSADSNCDM